MKYAYFDQHMHNNFSKDSKETAENYCKKAKQLGLNVLYFANHYDLDIDKFGYKDWIVDFEAEQKEYDRLSMIYPDIEIRRGIEIGYNPYRIDELNQLVKTQKFNHINFSLHILNGINFYEFDKFEGRVLEALDLFFKTEVEMAWSDFDYDIFSHLDFGFKTPYKVDRTLDIHKYENYLIEILKGVIAHDKVLEINTKVQETINNESHIRYILRLYKSLGGELLTVASDAHEANRLYSNIDKYIDIIKQEGFSKIVYFINRKRFFVDL